MTARRITVRGIIKHNGALFAIQPRSGGHRFWSTPGGGLNPGESLHDGLRRELIEETGVAPIIGRLLFIQQYKDSQREYLEFFFEVRNFLDYQTIDLAKTSHGQQEVIDFGFINPAATELLPTFLRTTIDQHRAGSRGVPVYSYL